MKTNKFSQLVPYENVWIRKRRFYILALAMGPTEISSHHNDNDDEKRYKRRVLRGFISKAMASARTLDVYLPFFENLNAKDQIGSFAGQGLVTIGGSTKWLPEMERA